MIQKQMMFITTKGTSCTTLTWAQQKEFTEQLKDKWPDHVSGFDEIDIDILWDCLGEICEIRESIVTQHIAEN